jgi:tellurite resistance protein TerC
VAFTKAAHTVDAAVPEVTFFREEDTSAWIIFTVMFFFLIAFDNLVLHRDNKPIGVGRAAVFTLFWIFCAACFGGYVHERFGKDAALTWASGYMLEWMLSFDNIFVFHLIFNMYKTPDYLKHKPLFWGIVGAVFFRLAFIFIGEYLMHAVQFAHIMFGLFLIYTGVMAAAEEDEDEDEDPTQNPFLKWLSAKFAFVPAFDSKGRFITEVPLDDEGGVILTKHHKTPRRDGEGREGHDNPQNGDSDGSGEMIADRVVDFEALVKEHKAAGGKTAKKLTLLSLVLLSLEVSDVIFAVDSVSAIVASVSDVFLAYTATVMAMLGLRATFFIIDELVHLFSLLKYGVAAVLVFIGVKLAISHYYEIPPLVVCSVLFSTIGLSMVLSVGKERWDHLMKTRMGALEDAKEGKQGVAAV